MARTHISGVALPETYAAETIGTMYRALSLPEETVGAVRQYFAAASHLYGIVPLKHLLHIYNEQNPPISQEAFLAVADVVCHEDNDFCILEMNDLYEDASSAEPMDREVVSLLILSLGLDRYYDLANAQAGKPYALLPKDRFLAYLDPGYYPKTSENVNMIAFLRKHSGCLERPARDVLRSIQSMIWLGMEEQEVMRCLGTAGFRFQNHADRRVFRVLFHAMARHTRTIANRGETPAVAGGHSSLSLAAHRRWAARLMSAARKYIIR